MQTMQLVLRRGKTTWDRGLLPDDEFVVRTTALRSLMKELDLEACAIIGGGDAYSNLTYFTNFIPLHHWATGVIPREGDPTLIVGLGGGREFPFYRTLTWVQDLQWHRSHAQGVLEILGQRGITGGRLGVTGLADAVPLAVAREFDDLRAQFELVDVTEKIGALRARKRPREIQAINLSTAIAGGAVQAAEQAFLRGESARNVLLAAERAARLSGARDIRLLANLWHPTQLCPLDPATDPDVRWPLTLYVAVESNGYWGDRGATLTVEHHPLLGTALEALHQARQNLRVGETGKAAVQAAQQVIEASGHGALAPELGSGVGVSLREYPIIGGGSDDVVHDGSVTSLRLHIPHPTWPVLVSDLVVMREAR